MATNKYFNNFAYAREQDHVEDLTIEAIKIYGHNVKYLPKTISGIDMVLFVPKSISSINIVSAKFEKLSPKDDCI